MKFEIKQTDLHSKTFLRKAKKGFTLIELLISMTITLVIVGLLMGMTKMAVGSWQKTNSKARSSRLAQEVFDSVGKDLEGIVIRTGNNYEWLLIETSENTATENGPDSNKEISNPIEVSFFSAVTDRYDGQINVDGEDEGGDISMVRYRLIHQDQIEANGAKPVFSLYRERIEPNETFEKLLAKDQLDSALPPSSEIVNRENFLAENIFDFTLSFNFEYMTAKIDSSTGEIKPGSQKTKYKRIVVQTSDSSRDKLSIKGDAVFVGGKSLVKIIEEDRASSDERIFSSPRLAGADISILVLSDGGMNSLEKKNISSPADLSKFLSQYGHHYSKSVILPQP